MSEARNVQAAIMAASRITGPEAIVAITLMQEFSDSENATLKEENDRLREALKNAVEIFEQLLEGQKNCGDPDAECPMQDAHKEKYDYEVAGGLRIAREALEKTNV